MAAWTVAVFFLAVGISVHADSRFAFPESFKSSRIVSGWEASEGQIPFQLSLRMVNPAGAVNACGGTIIHPEWGLTAGHCTAGRVTLVIRAGTVNLTQPALIFETTKYINHPLYNEAIQHIVQPHDIGLIEFGRVLSFGDLIQPIRIQRSSDMNRNYEEVQLIASGWGRTWTGGSAPENMNWVYLRGTSNEECLGWYGGSAIIQPSTICARYYNVTSQSTCQGDSGGPLTYIDDDGQTTQIGVTSFVSGTGCHTEFPAGFVRPGHYHQWFKEVTDIDFDWEYVPPTTIAPETTTSEAAPTTTEAAPTTTEAVTTTTEAVTTTTEAVTTTTESTAAPTTTPVATTTEEAEDDS